MFDAYGTEGLEIFTWVVAGLIGIIGGLVTTHILSVKQEDAEYEMDEELSDDEKMVV